MLECPGQMVFNGLDGDPQLRGNLVIPQSPQAQGHDLPLVAGQVLDQLTHVPDQGSCSCFGGRKG